MTTYVIGQFIRVLKTGKIGKIVATMGSGSVIGVQFPGSGVKWFSLDRVEAYTDKDGNFLFPLEAPPNLT